MVSVDELWLVDFGEPQPGEPASRRPALVLGPPDTFGTAIPFVIVAPLTTSRRGLSLHVAVPADAGSGLDETSFVQCELIRSANRTRLVRRLGAVDTLVGEQVSDVLKTLLNH